MTKHIVVLGSSYNSGKRIALDFTDIEDFNKFLTRYKQSTAIAHNSASAIATHLINTPTQKWADIVAMDSFFSNVELIKNEDKFLKLLEENSESTALDIANYILTYLNCKHTRLEKLTYYCYADYLCKYNKKMFNDQIYAYRFGPVISTVMGFYKKDVENPDFRIQQNGMALRSRILNSANGVEKMRSIDTTIERYKKYNSQTLVSATHRPNTPWSHNYRENIKNIEIPDKDIYNYHHFEEL